MRLCCSIVGAIAFMAAVAGPIAAYADGVPIENANQAQLGAAQKTFEAADQLFDSGQYESAIKAFRTSFDIVASPNSKLMIARSMEKLGNLPDAYAELENGVELAERAAAKDPKYEPTLKAVRDQLTSLKRQVGVLHVRLSGAPPSGASLNVGGRTIDAAALARPVVVAPGNVTIVAHAEGYLDARKEMKIGAGEEGNVALELTPAPKDQPPEVAPPPPADTGGGGSSLRTAAWVAGGVGVIGFVGFAVFGAMHLSKFSALEDACPNNRCPTARQSDIDSGRTYETIANVGLVVGAVGVVTGVTLFALSAKKKNAPPSASASLDVAPTAVRLLGRF